MKSPQKQHIHHIIFICLLMVVGWGQEYYKNGQIKYVGIFKDGRMDGKGIWYYENGRIWKEDNFKDGKIDGKWTFYNEDGSIKEVKNYKDGKLVKY